MRGMFHLSLCLVSLVLLAGQALAADDDAYRLDAGDVIRVAVWGHDDLQAEARVARDPQALTNMENSSILRLGIL